MSREVVIVHDLVVECLDGEMRLGMPSSPSFAIRSGVCSSLRAIQGAHRSLHSLGARKSEILMSMLLR